MLSDVRAGKTSDRLHAQIVRPKRTECRTVTTEMRGKHQLAPRRRSAPVSRSLRAPSQTLTRPPCASWRAASAIAAPAVRRFCSVTGSSWVVRRFHNNSCNRSRHFTSLSLLTGSLSLTLTLVILSPMFVIRLGPLQDISLVKTQNFDLERKDPGFGFDSSCLGPLQSAKILLIFVPQQFSQ